MKGDSLGQGQLSYKSSVMVVQLRIGRSEMGLSVWELTQVGYLSDFNLTATNVSLTVSTPFIDAPQSTLL